jgi:hypothetical protein
MSVTKPTTQRHEFAEELIRLGQADARRRIDERPADVWQLDPLPN